MSISSDHRQHHTAQVATPVWYGRLGRQLRALAKPILQQKKQGLFSITLEAAVSPPASPPQAQAPWVYWHRPAENHKLVGLGQCLMLEAEGKDRFIRLQDKYAALQPHWTHITQGKIRSQPRAFLGYGFDPHRPPHPMWKSYPASQLYVPGLLIEWRNGHSVLTFSCSADAVGDADMVSNRWLELVLVIAKPAISAGLSSEPLSILRQEPDESGWLDQVERVKQDISNGRLDKLVLSRCLSLRADQPVALAKLFPLLQDKYANCTLMAMNFGGASLVAATPERLFRVRSGKVEVDALAGTVAADDAAPQPQMQQFEHAPVVRAIRQALAPLCGQVEYEERPRRMLVDNLQHLWTPVRGRLRNKVSLFQLLDGLHPTPAVGGVPTARACEWIRCRESWRGWYTGGFGWVGDNREGDLAVLLRCALVDGRDAELFAGAGITSVSNAADELEETRMKLDVMLGALRGNG